MKEAEKNLLTKSKQTQNLVGKLSESKQAVGTHAYFLAATKGQLISKGLFNIIVLTKKTTKLF